MLIDSYLLFDPSGSAITTTRVSTNVLDMLANRDLGGGYSKMGVLATITAAFTASAQNATLNVQLQGAPDNGSGSPGVYTTLAESSPIPIGQLVAGNKIAQFDLASVANNPVGQASTTGTFTSGASSMTVASATGIQAGMYINGTGITPGTQVASSYTLGSTTVPLTAVTTAAVTAGAVAFSSAIPAPRFYQLNYVVANGPFTAGSVMAALVGDRDETVYYKSGFMQPY